MTENNKPEPAKNAAARLLASYGGVFISVALALVAYLSFRNALHAALLAFDVYVFAWRAIDIGAALIALIGILILSIADYYFYRKASANGRFLRVLLRQCGIIAALAVLFFFIRYVLL